MLVLGVLWGVLVSITSLAVFQALYAREIEARLRRLGGPEERADSGGVPAVWAAGLKRAVLSGAGSIGRRMPASFRERAVSRLFLSGMNRRYTADQIAGLDALAIAVGVSCALLVVATWDLAWIGGVASATLWPLNISRRIKVRCASVARDLPFVLEILTIAVDAGLPFDAAIAQVVSKGRPSPLVEELKWTLQGMRMGKTRVEALRDLSERLRLPEVNSFAVTLIQADQLGVGISKVLRVLADQMRSRRASLAEEQAMKAPVRMLLPLIFFIFPSLGVVLFGPVLITGIF